MLIPIQTLFNTELESKALVITKAQSIAIFNQTNQEFFSWVEPIVFMKNSTIDGMNQVLKPNKDVEIKADEYLLGIGKFKIKCTRRFKNITALRIQPLEYSDFKLSVDYHSDYALTARYYLAKSQHDNMDLLGGIGVQQIESENVTLQEVRERLEDRYAVSTAQNVALDTTNTEC